jgi:hypothetical protein
MEWLLVVLAGSSITASFCFVCFLKIICTVYSTAIFFIGGTAYH